MKITPLEIRQKTFEKVFRGYDKEEVNAFLLTMSQEWEKLMDENKSLSIKLESMENENRKLREVESSLYKTLKTAEDTGASMIEQANKAAELQIKETQMKAENIISESKGKAKSIIENSEKEAKQIVKDMMEEVKSLEQSYNMLMTLKSDLLTELKNFTSDALDKVEQFKVKKERYNIDKHIKSARDFAYTSEENPIYNKLKDRIDKAEAAEIKKEDNNKLSVKKTSGEDMSFFDMIE